MGKILLILVAGFAASFAILVRGKELRWIDSVERMVNQYTSSTAKNASDSGAYMALNRLYLTPSWRAGYNNLVLNDDTLSVTVQDNSVDTTLGAYQVKIRSTAGNAGSSDVSEVVVFDREFHEFAVWAKDTVISITAKDSTGGAVNPDLIFQNAPFMPKIEYVNLVNEATAQGNLETDAVFQPDDKYPDSDNNGIEDFYAPDGTTPNVTHVTGNLRVRTGRTVYGIFIVEGNAELERGANVEGILYFPNTSSSLGYHASSGPESLVKGGVVTWGEVDGTGGDFVVQHFPAYLRKFVNGYAPNNPPMRVLTWR